jgi:hypothetical protein
VFSLVVRTAATPIVRHGPFASATTDAFFC